MLAGASAVQVGTAIFKDPFIPLHIIDGIKDYMERHHLQSLNDLVGNLHI
jgi:dihydroorotate dehydrogenase (NAD+) catalytic subunit